MSQKKVNVANFNVVFLEEKDEAPLLKYFDSIVVPAFQSGIKKDNKDAELFFMNVEVVEDSEGEYVLVGYVVKKTVLEVKSDVDEKGNLIEKDEKYPSAPYSTFAIYLKNHRMVYVLNQKESPNIKSFSGLTKHVFAEYIRNYNHDVGDKSKYLPYPSINIVGLPMRSSIEDALKQVSKVTKLTLRFYPLNGDQEFGEMFGDLIKDLRSAANAKNGELMLRSPKSISGIINIVEQSAGTVKPIIDVEYADKTKGTIKEDQISEKMDIEFPGENVVEMDQVISKGKEIQSISYTSRGNQEIYNEHKSKIIKFLPKK